MNRRPALIVAVLLALPAVFIVSCQDPPSVKRASSLRVQASVSTLAGGTIGGAVRQPWGLTVNPTNDDVYLADAGEHTIKRIPGGTGAVTTVAGTANTPGYLDGTGTSARFNYPRGLAMDGAGGYIYIAETYANCIRRLTTVTGQVTLLTGIRQAGTADGGPGSAWTTAAGAGIAQMSAPWDIAWDPTSSTLLVTDSGTRRLRRVTAAGAVTTLTTFTGTPRGVAVDTAGQVYVAVPTENRVYQVQPDGTTIVAANATDPWDVAVDVAGNMFVSSQGTHSVYWKNAMGLSILAGTGVAGLVNTASLTQATDAAFNQPGSLAVDSGNTLYVAEPGNYAIRKLVMNGVVPTPAPSPSIPGLGGATPIPTPTPTVTPPPTPTPTPTITPPPTPTPTPTPTPISQIDLKIVATDSGGWGCTGGLVAIPINWLSGITVFGGGAFLTDEGRCTITRVDLGTGAVTNVVGVANQCAFAGDGGPASGAKMNGPNGQIAAQSYLCDSGNHRIRTINGSGTVSTVLGNGTAGSGLVPTGACLNSPRDAVAVGSDLFVADTQNHRILKANAGGLTLLAGSTTQSVGSADGTGSLASFSFPHALCYYSGFLYVADYGNGRIRKINVANGATTTVSLPALVTGQTSSVSYLGLRAITVSPNGWIYFATYSNVYAYNVGAGLTQNIYGADHLGFNDPVPNPYCPMRGGNTVVATQAQPSALFHDPQTMTLYIADSGNKVGISVPNMP